MEQERDETMAVTKQQGVYFVVFLETAYTSFEEAMAKAPDLIAADTEGSHSHEDRHKAPTSTQPFPLSLQDDGHPSPHSIAKVHQTGSDVARDCPIRIALTKSRAEPASRFARHRWS